MTQKILELTQILESANFIGRISGEGHYNYRHPKGINITICGNPNHIAKRYQINDVTRATKLANDE